MKALVRFLSYLHYISLLLLACFPLYGLNATGMIIIVWSLSALLWRLFTLRETSIKRLPWKPFVLLALPYFAYLIGWTYSENEVEAQRVLTQKLSLWVLPFGFAMAPYSVNVLTRQLVLRLFAFSVWILSIAGHLGILLEGFLYLGINQVNQEYSYFYRLTFEHLTGIHPTYISLFQWFSLFIFYDLYRQRPTSGSQVLLWKIGFAVIVVSSVVMNLLLGSRLPMLAFVLVLIGLAWKYLPSRLYRIGIPLVGLLLVVGGLFLVPGMRNRVNEMMQTEWKPPSGDNHNSVNTRIGSWRCATSLIAEHPLQGVGTGDVQTELNACYEQYDTGIYQGRNFNTHNEYLNLWVGTGLFGLLAFLIAVGFSFRTYRKQWLAVAFLVTFLLVAFTENLLGRQMGIVYFALLNSLFVFSEHTRS
ncbi:MAG: O-antigen ligase family protein [Leptolyngbya sp. SIO3F4]|nr:O-antigen ligase family protein [Leptolyngbya sp. SIO3F4]